ncbi:MAG: acyl-CoA dehydrogenase family protein, partial [Dehalococcoidia bacterium]|nr:acyl-CoA dehydrogenase family protein [Dehalococcoidia bacterium]
MDWKDSPEQASFRERVRAYIQERLPAYYRTDEHRLAKLEAPENDWQWDMVHGSDEAQVAATEWAGALAERGWAAPGWPSEYGGGGLTTLEQFVMKQEFAEADAPEVGGGNGIPMLGPTLLVHGTEEQKKKFLPPTL